MTDLNRVYLAGNLTKDPEVRYTPAGRAVGDIRLAVNRKFRTADGENRDETCFVNVVVWGRQAETCAEYLRKGSPLLVEGRLQYDEWEKDGQRYNRLRVVADRTQFIGAPRDSDREASPAAEAAPPPEDTKEATSSSFSGEQPSAENQDDDLPF